MATLQWLGTTRVSPGVFGIALGRVWREVEGDLAVLPAVRAEDGLAVAPTSEATVQDDLGKRRLRRTS
jgi:hypothetical protein